MATKQKDSAGKEKRGACASPMVGGSVHTDRRRLRPSASPETSVAKDHGKTRVQAIEKSSNTAGELSQSRHVPNYLKPTISSKTDVGSKHAVVTKKLQHSHDDEMQKQNPALLRRRSLDRPVPASQVHKAIQSSSSSARVAPALKNSAATVARTSSLERVSKVVKAVKSQPPLVKTKSLPPKTSSITGARKEVKTSGSKKADDLNVEEEVAKMGSLGGDLPTEKQLENVNHNSPAEHVDDAEHLQEEDEHAPEPVAEITENVNEETQVAVNEVHHVDQQNDDDTKKDDEEEEEEIIKPHVGLTVKTTPDEERTSREEEDKKDEEGEEKQAAKSSSSSAVHKRQVGVGGRNKKESPAYNAVIEETASKLVEKRVNKVRALAGAFETVISLQQPDSS